MATLSNLNQMTKPEFIDLLGSIYEHSPWVAEAAFAQQPFATRDDLIILMKSIVEAATDEEKLTLICAHPDLGGKLARAGKLTSESTAEQAGLGLDRLSDEEYQQFADLNASYLAKFDFPFIICAKLSTRPKVLAAFATRVQNSREVELKEALRQIHLIAQLRIEEKVPDLSFS
ncbi:MAG: 2-oxo-4-hydroxy-4-carboxy-5-ureidoimidazoline decarboxylase [Roseibacillus sp.]